MTGSVVGFSMARSSDGFLGGRGCVPLSAVLAEVPLLLVWWTGDGVGGRVQHGGVE